MVTFSFASTRINSKVAQLGAAMLSGTLPVTLQSFISLYEEDWDGKRRYKKVIERSAVH
jgi:hypothetical protein